MGSQEEAEWLARINRALRREDAQEFMQVYNLAGEDAFISGVNVRFRLLGGDFYAECQVRRKGMKRPRTIYADGEGRSKALENLASKVAEYLAPVHPRPPKKVRDR